MPAVMTYPSLVADILEYTEKSDAIFIARIPQIIALGENKIAREVKGLGQQQSVTDTMILADPIIRKPDRWRETISINYGVGAGNQERRFIFKRTVEFCRYYWPNPNTTRPPKYYADYSYEAWLIAPTPDLAYPFEVIYFEKAVPLDAVNQSNWNTTYAPDLLLAACLLESQPYLKNAEKQAVWQGMYDSASAGFDTENKRRRVDRATVDK